MCPGVGGGVEGEGVGRGWETEARRRLSKGCWGVCDLTRKCREGLKQADNRL